MSVDDANVSKNLSGFRENLYQNEYECLEKVCLRLESEGRKNCNVDTGMLRDSITHVIEETQNTLIGYIGSNIEYAPYIHQGTGIYAIDDNGRKEVPWRYKDTKGEWHSTKGIKPNPFLKNAVDNNRNTILNYFKELLSHA